jgi:hypothetical protein
MIDRKIVERERKRKWEKRERREKAVGLFTLVTV